MHWVKSKLEWFIKSLYIFYLLPLYLFSCQSFLKLNSSQAYITLKVTWTGFLFISWFTHLYINKQSLLLYM